MRSTDVRDELQDGFDNAALPPRAPDGGLELSPAPPLELAPPRLCEAGPCQHYHRMEVQLDAQNPMSERRAGRLVQHARVFHVTTHHYCYPDVGIETNLGSLPVLACNRWVPVGGLLRRLTGGRAAARRAYDREFAAWEVDRERESAELAGSADLGPSTLALRVVFTRPSAEALEVEIEIEGVATLADLVSDAVRRTEIQIDEYTYVVELDGSPVDNLAAEIDQLGITPGARVVVHLSNRQEPA